MNIISDFPARPAPWIINMDSYRGEGQEPLHGSLTWILTKVKVRNLDNLESGEVHGSMTWILTEIKVRNLDNLERGEVHGSLTWILTKVKVRNLDNLESGEVHKSLVQIGDVLLRVRCIFQLQSFPKIKIRLLL
jgi:hypothetical protein